MIKQGISPLVKWPVLSFLTGGLFWIGWVPHPVWPALLVAFVPILWVEDEITNSGSRKGNARVFLNAYLAFFCWNIFTTWWVANTTTVAVDGENSYAGQVAGLLASILNALLMCFPFLLFHITKRRVGSTLGYVSLVAYWLVFEFVHLRWDLSWPWLTLGNGLAMYPHLVQWYEYTGVPGGSVWILVCNILFFVLAKKMFSAGREEENFVTRLKKNYILVSSLAALIIVPVIISLLIYHNVDQNNYGFVSRKNIVVVQPNIDPYTDKFDPATLNAQVENLLALTKQKITDSTDYVVWPETAIPQGMMEDQLETNEILLKIRQFLRNYPRTCLLTGINGYMRYTSAVTPTARKAENGEFYYDAFNSAIQFNLQGNFQVYHKSMLVPGVEQMPYPKLFKFLEPLSINVGGVSGSLGRQGHRSVFFSPDETGVAPVICYESIYGEYCNEYVNRGAQIFCIMTNDGWWGNTEGHIQHLYYGALLAIETRKPIARSANTGISCFVDIKGDIHQAAEYWKPAVIQSWVGKTTEPTFYVEYGDYISRILMGVATWLLVYMLVKKKLDGAKKTV